MNRTHSPWTRLGLVAVATLLLAAAGSAARAQADPAEPDDELVEGRGMNEIVFIHGLGSSASVWDEVVPYLRGSFKVWLYEIPGHGRTPPLPGATIQKVADHLDAWLEEKGVVYPVLVGHAMGGLIALRYTFDHPADVRRLILIDASPRQLASQEEKLHVTESLLEDYDLFVARRYLNMSPSEEISQQVLDQALRTDSATFVSLLMSSFDFDLTDELSRQSVPMLVVGSQMFFPEPELAQVTLDQMGYYKARTLSFKVMEKTGHFVMLEQPSYLASVIVAFCLTHSLR